MTKTFTVGYSSLLRSLHKKRRQKWTENMFQTVETSSSYQKSNSTPHASMITPVSVLVLQYVDEVQVVRFIWECEEYGLKLKLKEA